MNFLDNKFNIASNDQDLLQLLIVSKSNLDQGFGGEKWIRDVAIEASYVSNVLIVTADEGNRNVSYTSELTAKNNISIIELNKMQRKSLLLSRQLIPEEVDTIYFVDSPFSRDKTKKFINLFPNSFKIKGNHTPISVYENKPKVNLFIRLYFKFIKPWRLSCYKSVNLQHTLNLSDLKALQKKYNCTMIPNGVTPPEKLERVKYSKFTLVLVGRLNYQKGVDRISKILKMLSLNEQDLDILILGNGPYLRKLKKITHKSLKILGFVSETEKQNIIQKSHFLLSLSRWEVFPYSIIESLSMGTPVISFKIQGALDMISDNYNGFLASDLKALTKIIEHAFFICRDRIYFEMMDSAIESSRKYYTSKIMPEIMRMLHCSR